MASSNDEDQDDLFGGEGEDGLFGDEDGDQSGQERRLSDEELDSGDDDRRDDRAPQKPETAVEATEENGRVIDASIARQDVPTSTDEQVRSTRITRETQNGI
jgi:RNA polymerase-associated protein LEO1